MTVFVGATVLTFQTTYRVMMADRLLKQAGVIAGLMPTPQGVESPCGLSIRLTQEDILAARQVLASGQIEIRASYAYLDGRWCEVGVG